LSKWAIKKHRLKICAVVGTSGTKLTAEMFAEMLAKDHIVRRQLEIPFWDFSIPLSILGIDDKKYSVIGWFEVLLYTAKVLLLVKPSPGWVVLQMNSLKEGIVDYWLEIVSPDLMIASNFNGDFFPIEKKVANRSKKVVFVHSGNNFQNKYPFPVITVGRNKKCDLNIVSFSQSKHGSRFVVMYKGKKHALIAAQTGFFMKGPILASVGGLIALGKSLEDVAERLRRVEISVERFIHE